jgi:predicted amino acid racemase
MTEIIIHSKRIIDNIKKIDQHMKKHNMKWSLVAKLLSGDKNVLQAILSDDVVKGIHSIADSRLQNLKRIKEINPKITTAYIKLPAVYDVEKVIRYADISYNTTLRTLKALDKEAKKQNKIHKVVIMIELGELREGILGKDLVKLYADAFKLLNIKIIGIGSNLGCMYGVEPSYDKLVQLALYKQLLEEKFKTKMELISGGSSITLPLLGFDMDNLINHFRIGEAVFLGTSPFDNKRFNGLSTNCFEFRSDIIELKEKLNIPTGKISDGNVGHVSRKKSSSNRSYKAIVDFGLVDVDASLLNPKDSDVEFVGTTSDMTVYSVGQTAKNYEVGDKIKFTPSYMAVAKLMSAQFVKKIVK